MSIKTPSIKSPLALANNLQLKLCLLGLAICLVGCNRTPDDGISFSEIEQSQPITVEDFSELRFSDKDGNPVQLSKIMTKKYLVLIITRGWNGGVCLYCVSQTSRWARRYDELDAYDAQLVVIFPTKSNEDAPKLDEMTKKIKGGEISNEEIPYPILLDIELAGVNQLGIRDELAKPSTYIIDRDGRVRFAYIGKSIADRPSVDAVLTQLEQLNR